MLRYQGEDTPIDRREGCIFSLFPYCPHLNIAETLWHKLKKEWLNSEDYLDKEKFFYAVNRCFTNVGVNLKIVTGISGKNARYQ